jgi:hypothetical protein
MLRRTNGLQLGQKNGTIIKPNICMYSHQNSGCNTVVAAAATCRHALMQNETLRSKVRKRKQHHQLAGSSSVSNVK